MNLAGTLSLGASTRKLKREEILWTPGAQPDRLYVVIKGLVRVDLLDAEGHEVTISIAGPGTVLGLTERLEYRPYATTGIAVTKSEVAVVDLDAVVFHPRATLYEELYREALHQSHETALRLARHNLGRTSIYRVYEALRLYLEAGHHPSQFDLGRLAGCSREQATRCVQQLVEAGAVERTPGAGTATRYRCLRIPEMSHV